MNISVTFPGGKRVDATAGAFTIRTDQPVSAGGEGSAPEPFTLFLASLGTCAGIYVLGFCRARGIATEGIELEEIVENDPATGRPTRITIEVHVPATFPAEHREGIARAAGACKVKKVLADPPELVVATVHAGSETPRDEPISN